MDRIVNRPFFSLDVLVIAVVVILLGLLVSGWLADALHRLLFQP
jgi:hypothetical protein